MTTFEILVIIFLIAIALLITWAIVGLREIAINLQNTVNNLFTIGNSVGEIKESLEESKEEN